MKISCLDCRYYDNQYKGCPLFGIITNGAVDLCEGKMPAFEDTEIVEEPKELSKEKQ